MTEETTSRSKSGRGVQHWLQLLLLPILLIAGVIWLTVQQNQLGANANRQQHDTALQIANDQQQAVILATYQSHISDMLLHDNLLTAPKLANVRQVAEVETLTALRALQPAGKALLMRYLFDTRLINNDYHIISLTDADLHNAALQGLDLRDTNLTGANLSGADLRNTNLSYATLNYVNLTGANLAQADLHGSDLHSTDFTNANLAGINLKDATESSEQQLARARSLSGAILPNGSTHQ